MDQNGLRSILKEELFWWAQIMNAYKCNNLFTFSFMIIRSLVSQIIKKTLIESLGNFVYMENNFWGGACQEKLLFYFSKTVVLLF